MVDEEPLTHDAEIVHGLAAVDFLEVNPAVLGVDVEGSSSDGGLRVFPLRFFVCLTRISTSGSLHPSPSAGLHSTCFSSTTASHFSGSRRNPTKNLAVHGVVPSAIHSSQCEHGLHHLFTKKTPSNQNSPSSNPREVSSVTTFLPLYPRG